MKIELDLKSISIETKEELFEFIKTVNYLPSLSDNYNGANTGDALEWDLMDFIQNHFDNIIGLRSKDPNLIERFNNFVEFLNNKSEEFEKTLNLMEKYDDKRKDY